MEQKPAWPWTPVDIKGIAERLGVKQATVLEWRKRSANEWVRVAKFPEPAGKISNRPWWWLSDIITWASQTGRTVKRTDDDPQAH